MIDGLALELVTTNDVLESLSVRLGDLVGAVVAGVAFDGASASAFRWVRCDGAAGGGAITCADVGTGTLHV